jgi:hypothetical protein
MNIKRFLQLDHVEQENAVWDGVFLIEIETEDGSIALFSVGNFFVELLYNQEEKTILAIKPFKNLELIEPYLNKIQLSDLYS